MRNYFFLLFFCWFIFSCSNDRSKNLLSGKSYAEIFTFFDSIGVNDKGSAFIDSLDKLNNDKFSDQTTLQTALAAIRYSKGRYDTSSNKEAFFIAAIEKTKSKKWEKLHAEALQQLGSYTWIITGDKNKALQYYNRGYLVYNDLTPGSFPPKFVYLAEYAGAYYSFEQYDKAIALLTEAVKLGDLNTDKGLFISGWNTLGLCYRAKGEYDKAIGIFNDVLAYAKKKNDETWQTIIRGNIGTVYHLMNKPEAARPLLEEEVIRGTTKNDWKSASSARLYLGEIELNAGNTVLAKEGFLTAREYLLRVKLDRSSKILKRIFDDLIVAYRLLDDHRQAMLYTDSARIVNDSIQKKFGVNVLIDAQNKIDLATYDEERKVTERINRFTRNMLIGGIILLAIVSVLFITRQRTRYNQKQKKAQAEKERMERELQAATNELHHFARSIEEKNNIIERIEQLQTDKQDAEEKYEILSKLEKSVLLTDEQWNEFTGLFEKVYGNFLLRLKDKIPSISPAEMRIIALGKLKLSNKTMAGMLGITPDAVRMNKFRIRKKLNLDEEAEFEKFLQTV